MNPNKYWIFLSMGFELVGLVITSVFIGQSLDEKLGTRGLSLLFLTLACLAGWMVHLIFLLKRIERSSEKDPDSET